MRRTRRQNDGLRTVLLLIPIFVHARRPAPQARRVLPLITAAWTEPARVERVPALAAAAAEILRRPHWQAIPAAGFGRVPAANRTANAVLLVPGLYLLIQFVVAAIERQRLMRNRVAKLLQMKVSVEYHALSQDHFGSILPLPSVEGAGVGRSRNTTVKRLSDTYNTRNHFRTVRCSMRFSGLALAMMRLTKMPGVWI